MSASKVVFVNEAQELAFENTLIKLGANQNAVRFGKALYRYAVSKPERRVLAFTHSSYRIKGDGWVEFKEQFCSDIVDFDQLKSDCHYFMLAAHMVGILNCEFQHFILADDGNVGETCLVQPQMREVVLNELVKSYIARSKFNVLSEPYNEICGRVYNPLSQSMCDPLIFIEKEYELSDKVWLDKRFIEPTIKQINDCTRRVFGDFIADYSKKVAKEILIEELELQCS